MTTKLKMDGDVYSRLTQEIVNISNASYAMKDDMPAGLRDFQYKLDCATREAWCILRDEVMVPPEPLRGHINIDADWPGLDKDVGDLIREEEKA